MQFFLPCPHHLLQLLYRDEIGFGNCLHDTLTYFHCHLGSSNKDLLVACRAWGWVVVLVLFQCGVELKKTICVSVFQWIVCSG